MTSGGRRAGHQASYLYVTQWFPPEPPGLPVFLMEAIQELGLYLTVVTGIPNYPSGNVHSGFKPWKRYRDRFRGSSVVRVPLFPSHSASRLGRTANYASFALSSSVFTLSLARQSPGVIMYGSPVTAGLMPLVARYFFRTPYMIFVEDLWPDSLFESSMAPVGLVGRGVRTLAAWFSDLVYRNARLLVAITDGMASELVARGHHYERVAVAKNWAKNEFTLPLAPSGQLRQRLAIGCDDLILLYAGNLGTTHDLPNWVKAVRQLADSFRISLVFMGDGAARRELESLADALKCTNVHFIDRVSEDSFLAMFADADAVVVSLRRGSGLATAMPSKIPNALAAGKIVLASVDGDAAEAVQLAGGLVSGDGSVESVQEVISIFATLSKQERLDRSKQALSHYSETMSRSVGLRDLQRCIKAAFGERDSRGIRKRHVDANDQGDL